MRLRLSRRSVFNVELLDSTLINNVKLSSGNSLTDKSSVSSDVLLRNELNNASHPSGVRNPPNANFNDLYVVLFL